MRFFKSKFKLVYESAITYPAPLNLSYNYNFGISAFCILMLQIITGIFLVMYYCPNSLIAFSSVEHIMRDIPYGWLIRYLHANGASFFFIMVYGHICRAFTYGSFVFPRRLLWCSGVLILLLMIITAFLGYVLPWGQMSYWAATVITNLASTIPLLGQKIVYWLWSGFSVDNPTLNKFFSLHYILPFAILGLVLIHFALLHQTGSSNPLGPRFFQDSIPFHPFYTLKDTLSVIIMFFFLVMVVTFAPNYLGHPDNYIPANPDSTPEHIVPEWYFLPFYAILRSIPNKSLGVLALVASIVVLFLLPFIVRPKIRNVLFKPMTLIYNQLFIANCIVLGFIGQSPLQEPFLSLGRASTLLYFLYFVFLAIVEYLDHSMVVSIKKTDKI